MEDFDCLQSYVGALLAGELATIIAIVWRSPDLPVTILLQLMVQHTPEHTSN